MKQKRLISLLLCAALAVCLLAGCTAGTPASSDAAPAASASSTAPAASTARPSSTTEASTPGLGQDFDENSLFSISGTADAFAPCLGWGPGVSGCSLKSVIAAASLLDWAENTNLKARTTDAVETAFGQWYDALDEVDQQSFAEAWPLICADADQLLTDKDSMTGRIEDAGLAPAKVGNCSKANWAALADVITRLTPEALGEY